MFFALPDLILDALKGSPPYEARHARVATAFVFLNGATVVILGCATTLVSWFTINVSVVRDDMVQRWLEKARYITCGRRPAAPLATTFAAGSELALTSARPLGFKGWTNIILCISSATSIS